jgi:uncharacterized protein (TIGR00661 family)
VDVLISGYHDTSTFPFKVKYRFRGLSYHFAKNGKIDILKTFINANLVLLARDILACKLEKYDFIVNDFEPVSAWAAIYRKVPSVGLSHQASFLSKKVPRPERKVLLGEFVLRNFAPSSSQVAFHFQKYDKYILTPIIRRDVQQAKISNLGHLSIYLPAYSDERLLNTFHRFKDKRFQVFSKYASYKYTKGNVDVFPISNKDWINSLASSDGAVMGAGFEGPAEALFLGKRLYAIPMKGQYEQACNAAALKNLGVFVGSNLELDFIKHFDEWVSSNPVQIDFQDNTEKVVRRIYDYGKAIKYIKTHSFT